MLSSKISPQSDSEISASHYRLLHTSKAYRIGISQCFLSWSDWIVFTRLPHVDEPSELFIVDYSVPSYQLQIPRLRVLARRIRMWFKCVTNEFTKPLEWQKTIHSSHVTCTWPRTYPSWASAASSSSLSRFGSFEYTFRHVCSLNFKIESQRTPFKS